MDDSDIRTIVATFITPFLSVNFIQVDNGEGGKLGVVLIERDGSWHIIKRQLKSKDNKELYLTPGETYSRDGSKKIQLDGEHIIRILGDETQRKLAEIVSPMSDRIRHLESEIEKLKNDLTKTRPDLTVFFSFSDNFSKEHLAELESPQQFYTGEVPNLSDLLVRLEQMGANSPQLKDAHVTPDPLRNPLFLINMPFEKKQKHITIKGSEVAGLLKQIFNIEKDPALFQCDDVIREDLPYPVPSHFPFEKQHTYLGKDVERYEIVKKIQRIIDGGQEWLKYYEENSRLIYLPIAIQNNGGAPGSDIVIELRDCVKCCGNKFRPSLTPSWFFLHY